MRNVDGGLAAVVCLAVAIIGGLLGTGAMIEQNRWRAETVKRGFAEYDSETGKWQWKGPTNEQE